MEKVVNISFISAMVIFSFTTVVGVEVIGSSLVYADDNPQKPTICAYSTETPPFIPPTRMHATKPNVYDTVIGSTWIDADFSSLGKDYDIRFFQQDDNGGLTGPDDRKYFVIGGDGGDFSGSVEAKAETVDGNFRVVCQVTATAD